MTSVTRHCLLCFLLWLPCSVLGTEPCKLEHLTELEYQDIECQFYMGTAAYRGRVYSVAAAHWKFILDAPLKYEGDEEFQATALSTVTFLTYHGLGVEQDRHEAVAQWEKAVDAGDLEARRHLGYAYSDDKYQGRDKVKALGWYESIFLIFPSKEDVPESDLGIYDDALEGAEPLRGEITDSDRARALTFAKSTL